MDQQGWLAEQFEAHRPQLRGVAYRMLGSLSEAEDAVQAAWLRFSRADTDNIENMGGWLRTVVSRVCLDMLRSRKSRREDSLEDQTIAPALSREESVDPEQEALLADSVGLALLVVLDTLEPAERLAFVLHDLFAMPFEDIAGIVGRSSTAARQLASRARRRVQGGTALSQPDLIRQREVVNAFLTASRSGDFAALLTLLDPEVVLRSDQGGKITEIQGAEAVATRARKGGARAAQAALINGVVGVIVAPRGRLMMVLNFTLHEDKIVAIEAIADPIRLSQLDFALLDRE